MNTTQVQIVYFNAGGGHRAAAHALCAALQAAQPQWRVRLHHLAELLDRQAGTGERWGASLEALYNVRLQRGWTLGMARELKLLQALIRSLHGPLVRRLEQHWLRTEPDLVVSVIPNFNRALGQSLAGALPGVPFVTVLTDMADLPPHFWIEPTVPQHVVCGSALAIAQAQAAGVPPARVHAASGMLLRPSFYEPDAPDRCAARAALGLDPARTTAVVFDGGQGSARMGRIAQALPELQLILLCGRNAALAQRLRAPAAGARQRAPRAVLGFTDDVARVLRLADFFIGKPGPGALSEAVHLGLPVITFLNRWTMPQERPNAAWVRSNGYGLVLRSLRELAPAVQRLERELPQWRARVATCRNEALFELPAILHRVLDRSRRPRAAAAAWAPFNDPATEGSLG